MESVQNTPGSRKRPSVTGHLHPVIAQALAPLAALLLPMLAHDLKSEKDTDPWIGGKASPLGGRTFNRLCRDGKIEGARKHGARWLCRRSDHDRYLEQNGVAPSIKPAADVLQGADDATDRALRAANLQRTGGRR